MNRHRRNDYELPELRKLQTTYGTAWIGASGGIVAQLYHAYENNEYNLIGCGNYGSIFTANGRKHTFSKEESDAGQTGANDSAGILGNITNYEATSQEKSQSYTVQILDCVNAPGVEIYSASMASGIFGFLSSDNPAGETIKKSTGNVVIRIERCRNFARVLKGAQYTAGIFGDRYGAEAWKNHTIVKDNYSVRMTTTYQSPNNSPIYSAQSGYSKSNGPGTISPESNRAHNYYMNGSDNGDHQFDDVSIGHGKTVGSGTKIAYSMSEWLRGLHANPSAFMYDIDEKKYFVADITIGDSVSGINGDYIDENNNIIQKSTGKKLGKILYYLEDTRYTYKELENKSTVNVDDTVFVNARTSYRRLEGIKDNKLVAPKNVTASVEQGKIKVEITPWTLQEAGVDPFSTDPCDPFAYMVRLEDSEGHSYTHSLYTEDGSFELPVDTGLTGELKVFVRAVSMFDDVKDSDEVSGGSVLNPTLPDPDIRIQLIYTGPNNNNFAYQISLNNLDAYSAYDSWQTVVNIEREGNVVLTAENPIQQLPVKQNKNAIYQMTAQTTMNSGTTDIQASQVVSTGSQPAWRRRHRKAGVSAGNRLRKRNFEWQCYRIRYDAGGSDDRGQSDVVRRHDHPAHLPRGADWRLEGYERQCADGYCTGPDRYSDRIQRNRHRKLYSASGIRGRRDQYAGAYLVRGLGIGTGLYL